MDKKFVVCRADVILKLVEYLSTKPLPLIETKPFVDALSNLPEAIVVQKPPPPPEPEVLPPVPEEPKDG